MLYITVHLYGKTGIAGEFKDYETKALNIFRRHGGEVCIEGKLNEGATVYFTLGADSEQ